MTQHDPESPDPRTLLSPAKVPDACREALEAGHADAAKRAFARALRDGGPRMNRSESFPARTRAARGEARYLEKQRAVADDALEGRYTGVFGVMHEFAGEIDWAHMQAMICNGLAHVGFMLPELALAPAFSIAGLDRAIGQLERQIYPDGLEDELAPGYGKISMQNLLEALKLAQWAAPAPDTVPARAWRRVGDIAEALGTLAAPDGRVPGIHDSPAVPVAPLYEDLTNRLDRERFASAPWRSGASALLPWGGFGVLRDRDEGYALLDAGPEGTCHAHADALQVLLHDGTRFLAADPGKPRYDHSALTQHLKSSAAHNVVLIDDKPHCADPAIPRPWRPFPVAHHAEEAIAFAAARRSAAPTDGSGAPFTHERFLASLPEIGWLVLDRLSPHDGASHRWHWLWHTELDALEAADAGAIGRANGEAVCRIAVAGAARATARVVAGEETPRLRGWRSGVAPSNEPVPTPTLEVTADGAAPWLFTLFARSDEASVEAAATAHGYEARVRAGARSARIVLDAEEELTRLRYEGEGESATECAIEAHTVAPTGGD